MSPLNILDVDASERTERILDGYVYIASRFERLALEIKVLNSWMHEMPALLKNDLANMPEGKDWVRKIEHYQNSGDVLTDSIVENANRLNDFMKAVLDKINAEDL